MWYCAVSLRTPWRVSQAQRHQGKYFTAGLHFVCRKVVSSTDVGFYFALFIYLFSSSLIFVESCPKQFYGASWQIYGSQSAHREKLVPYGKREIEKQRMREGERDMGSSGGLWMGSKIRAVSREINLQHCRETRPHFISSAAATSADLRASITANAHADMNKTHMLHKLSQRTTGNQTVWCREEERDSGHK